MKKEIAFVFDNGYISYLKVGKEDDLKSLKKLLNQQLNETEIDWIKLEYNEEEIIVKKNKLLLIKYE